MNARDNGSEAAHPRAPRSLTEKPFGQRYDYGAVGLTKREYFAALAMQGLLARGFPCDAVASQAAKLADDLLLALEEDQ